MPRRSLVIPLLMGALLAVCSPAYAQADAGSAPPADVAAPSPASPAELDETLVNLPTTMPLKRHKGYFRLTHRFARDLRQGSFGSLAQDLFSLDNGAVMGLEYRYGVTSTVQAGLHRTTLGKTTEAFGRWDAVRQSEHSPIGVSPEISIEGQNNLRQDAQPGASITVSHLHGTRLMLYASPTYVHGAHVAADDPSTALDTVFVGLGARVRLLETVSVVVEGSPRISGYAPDEAAWGAAIEKLTRGHVLQLNFGNSFGTTPGMLARGGARHEVYMGFNLSRKF